MKELILLLAEKDKDALAPVRCFPGLLAASDGEQIWLRGIPANEKTAIEIRSLPALETFLLDEENRLFPLGKLTPNGKLKSFNWISLQEFLPVVLPVSPLPGKTEKKFKTRLIPSNESRENTVLLARFSELEKFIETASEARLKGHEFALAENGTVLIKGIPLIPIPGNEYFLSRDLLIPSGFDFDPPAIAPFISEKLNPAKTNFILFNYEGSWEYIPCEAFVPLSRSAVRMTAEGIANG